MKKERLKKLVLRKSTISNLGSIIGGGSNLCESIKPAIGHCGITYNCKNTKDIISQIYCSERGC